MDKVTRAMFLDLEPCYSGWGPVQMRAKTSTKIVFVITSDWWYKSWWSWQLGDLVIRWWGDHLKSGNKGHDPHLVWGVAHLLQDSDHTGVAGVKVGSQLLGADGTVVSQLLFNLLLQVIIDVWAVVAKLWTSLLVPGTFPWLQMGLGFVHSVPGDPNLLGHGCGGGSGTRLILEMLPKLFHGGSHIHIREKLLKQELCKKACYYFLFSLLSHLAWYLNCYLELKKCTGNLDTQCIIKIAHNWLVITVYEVARFRRNWTTKSTTPKTNSTLQCATILQIICLSNYLGTVESQLLIHQYPVTE